ncbi:MAG: hypothetical protein HKN16_06185, partial [Saprospiraceae bacterium]|nr:hypothetical protein [Saprospiraceae bacterium]
MDLQYLWNILSRRKWLILTVAITTAIATYFVVEELEPKYKADGQFSTGIVDYKGINVEEDNFFLQKFTVEISFGNLIELMKSSRNVRLLTYRLLHHDLKGDEKPFRTLDPDEEYDFNYSQEEIDGLVGVLEQKLDGFDMDLGDPKLEKVYLDLAEALAYDGETLLKTNLTIDRKNETDFIQAEFVSEDPDLSFFAVDHFCRDFQNHYEYLQLQEGEETVGFFSEEVQKKRAELMRKQKLLDDYKYNRNLVDLDAQRNAIVTQITEMELQKQGFQKDIPALEVSIADINRRISELDNISTNSANERIKNNTAIQNLTKAISVMETEYREGGFKDASLKNRIDIYRKNLNTQIERLAKLEPQSEEDELD